MAIFRFDRNELTTLHVLAICINFIERIFMPSTHFPEQQASTLASEMKKKIIIFFYQNWNRLDRCQCRAPGNQPKKSFFFCWLSNSARVASQYSGMCPLRFWHEYHWARPSGSLCVLCWSTAVIITFFLNLISHLNSCKWCFGIRKWSSGEFWNFSIKTMQIVFGLWMALYEHNVELEFNKIISRLFSILLTEFLWRNFELDRVLMPSWDSNAVMF